MPPLKFFVPNGFTALSLVLGLASVAMSVEGRFDLAAWMILWGTLLDKADGSAARLLGATSKFGVEFDSFADFCAFGIAPAALVYFRLMATGDYVGLPKLGLMISAGFYVLALAIRLSRFNVTVSDAAMFQGVPGTLLGAVVAAGYLTWDHYGLHEAALVYSPAYLVLFAALMVSSLRIPKLAVRKSRALNVFQFANVAAAYVLGPLMLFPQYLFALAVAYLVGGLAVGLFSAPASAATLEAEPSLVEEPEHATAAEPAGESTPPEPEIELA
jgi:CDP-diacylglycerol---serine O-phosphatidyltransferase